MCSCHSILECCVTFSGVKLSKRSFVLFFGLQYMGILTFCHCDVKMTSYIKIFCEFEFRA